jgi:DNA-binding transcriptional regulator GbsR (MarR family)
VPDDRGQVAEAKDPMFDYIERFAAVLVAAGFPAMPARVFVALLIADSGRLTAAELAGTLRISPAAVSGAVRYLIQVGLIHKERVPGSRRDYYRMPGNMWDDLLRMRDQVMSRWGALVREGIDLVGPGTEAGARMAEQAAFLDFATREMAELLARWEKYRAERA